MKAAYSLILLCLSSLFQGQQNAQPPQAIEVGKPEPSPIPEKLAAEAKKAFAKKMPYFIWSDDKAPKAKDFQLKFALNPEMKEQPAFTVAKFIYTAPPEFGSKKSQRVPLTSTGEGIKGFIPQPPDGKFKGATDVTYWLIQASDARGPDGKPNWDVEKVKPISNTVIVKLRFE